MKALYTERKNLTQLKAWCQDYFDSYKTRYSNLNIIPLYGKCTDPKNIVRFTKEQINQMEGLEIQIKKMTDLER